jgi:uncharacterized membrane protein YecN with MAPEG domain
MHTAPYFTALGLLTIYHAMRIIRLRRKYRVGIGDGGHDDLAQMMRVFGNHIEYAPLGLILLAGLEFVQAPVWYLHLAGGTLLMGRCLHAVGLSTTIGVSPARYWGMVTTFTSLGVSSIGMTLFSILNIRAGG